MTFLNLLIPFVAAILGGTLNSVAGGGSFFTFPSLISVGILPIQANTTSTVALWPGSLAAAWALRKELAKQNKALLLLLVLASLVGGILGAELLLHTSQKTFVHIIPFLILLATLLFAISPLINARLKRRKLAGRLEERHFSTLAFVLIGVLQLIIAIYGGYFGGGIGIMMLAMLGLMGMEDIYQMNALKNVLASCINGVAVVTFVILGAVVWLNALIMIVGAIIGGYGGAYYASKLNPRWIRGFVIVVGTFLTLSALFSWPAGFWK